MCSTEKTQIQELQRTQLGLPLDIGHIRTKTYGYYRKTASPLGIGSLSPEIIEAVFRYSSANNSELMLISSKNQIDYNGGYVEKWNTKQYLKYIEKMKRKYPASKVKICRDHCGPNFNGITDLKDTYRTIKEDIERGFDLIHIDFSNLSNDLEDILSSSKKAIEYCLKINPSILLEIGTEQNVGMQHKEIFMKEIENQVNYFCSFCEPTFVVVQTGSLVKEMRQIGSFNSMFISSTAHMLHKKDIKLKEHNSDYLSAKETGQRRGVVDAMNISPQLGTIQMGVVFNKSIIYGINLNDFLNEVYQGRKWDKWMYSSNYEDRLSSCLMAGYYHFSSGQYKKVIHQLEKVEDIREGIMKEITNLITHYLTNYYGNRILE